VAVKLDPLDNIFYVHPGWHYLFSRQPEKAVEEVRRAVALHDQS
jgi:hypothetical protein